MEIIDKSLRRKLIELTVEHILSDHTYDHVNFSNLREVLQSGLNSELNFETIVSEFEKVNDFTVGKIHFKNECGESHTLDVTVVFSNDKNKVV